jgi:thioredoxin 1
MVQYIPTLMSLIIDLTESALKEAIQSSAPVLVDFWAPWCGPCKAMHPALERVAGLVDGRATVARINIDTAEGSVLDFDIRAIPTLVVFQNGKVVTRITGLQSEAAVMAILSPHLKTAVST